MSLDAMFDSRTFAETKVKIKQAAGRPRRRLARQASGFSAKKAGRSAQQELNELDADDVHALAAVYELAQKLYEVGGIDQKSMRQYLNLWVTAAARFKGR